MMGGWLVAGVALGALLVGLCVGGVVAAYFTYRAHLQELIVARAAADRERDRADNALDALAKQMRGEPISVAARIEDARTFEHELRSREDLQEMFKDETDDVPS